MIPLQVNDQDLNEVVTLTDIPDASLPAIVKEIMLAYYVQSVTPYSSPFLVELFAVDNEERSIPLEMDEFGVISSTIDLELRKRHYLRLSLLVDLRRLPRRVLQALAKEPTWMLAIINMINPNAPTDNLKVLGGGAALQMESLENLLNGGDLASNGKITTGHLTGGPPRGASAASGRGPSLDGRGGRPGSVSHFDGIAGAFNAGLIGYFVETNIEEVQVTVRENP